MSFADRRAWRSAETIADLGQLTAQWLEGTRQSQAGYAPRCGPEPETRPLTRVLVALNRAGVFTSDSQPGNGTDDSGFRQRAAVDAFVDEDTWQWLVHVLAGTRFKIVGHDLRAAFEHRRPGVWVTVYGGRPFTRFGQHLTAYQMAKNYSELSEAGLAALTSAVQVTIYDPEWGRNELWSLLHAAAEARRP